MTFINTWDGSTLGDDLITSHQVDYISSAFISAESVKNNQEYIVADKVGSIASLVTLCA